MGIPEREEGVKGTEEISEAILTVFHQINVRVQTTDSGSLENIRQGKSPQNFT